MKKLITLMIVAASFLSCSDDGIRTEQDLSKGPKVIGFDKTLVSMAYFDNIGAVQRQVPVNLLGLGNGQVSNSDITVSYRVNQALSTATEGVEFSFPSASRSITIPAGTTFSTIPLTVNTGSLNPTQKTEVVIDLIESTTGSVIGTQFKSVKIIFVGCATSLEGNYRYGTSTSVVVTKIAPNMYRSNYLPAFASRYWFEFSDVCGDLTIMDWEYQGGNPLSSASSADNLVHGVILPNRSLKFNDANCAGVSWYVNLSWTLVRL